MELRTYFAQGTQGNVLPGAAVTLYQAGTLDLVTGLQDTSGSALLNPFTAGVDGKISVRAPNGEYDMVVAKSGFSNTLRVSFSAPTSRNVVSVSSAEWVGAGPYTQVITAVYLGSTDTVIIDNDLSAVVYADIADTETAYSKIYRAEVGAGTITFYAKEVPAKTLSISVVVV